MSDDGSRHTLQIAREGVNHVVTATGELDITNVSELRAAIVGAVDGAGRVVVDLREVCFLDSSALNTLIGAREALAESGVVTRVVAPVSPAVRRVLEITRLGDLLPVVETRAEALR